MKFQFETRRERHLAITSGLLLLCLGATGLFSFRQYKRASQASWLATRPFSYQAEISPEKRLAPARFRPNELIIEFAPSANDTDKRKAYQSAGVAPREVLHEEIQGNTLTSGENIGEVVLAELTPSAKRVMPTQVQKALQTTVSPIANIDPDNDFATNAPLGGAMAALSRNRLIKFVQPNYLYALSGDPNDDYYQKGLEWNMYHSKNSGADDLLSSEFGTHASVAWDKGIIGDYQIYVAVIDSGIDATHADLATNVDTTHAIDYVRDPKNPGDIPFVNKDEIGHGTHVAGIIGAVGNNSIGVAGITWKVKLIPFKVVRAGGNQLIDDAVAIKAFLDVVKLKQQGVNIVAVNASWGSYGIRDNSGRLYPDYALLKVIKEAARAGVLCVASAGNNGNNNDDHPVYPSSFNTQDKGDGTDGLPFNAIISVAALSPDGSLWQYSNYGKKSVQLAAPGVAIVSPIATGSQLARSGAAMRSVDGSLYAPESGTSMAAPHVTGAIALYYGSHPDATPQEAHEKILSFQVPTASLTGYTISGGRLDLTALQK